MAGFTVRAPQIGGGQRPLRPAIGGVIQPSWGDERVYGHAPAEGDFDEAQQQVVKRIRGAVKTARKHRRRSKREILAQVYRERAKFGPDADREALKAAVGGEEFLSGLFGQKGSYVPDLEGANVTSRKIQAHLGDIEGLEVQDHPDSLETRVHLQGKHIYTFYRGASAFEEAGKTKAGRTKFKKHGSVDKKYVADDRGTPTRRFAYGVKDSTQVGLVKADRLSGRFVSVLKQPNLKEALPEEFGRVGKAKGASDATIDDDTLLYLHQELGSSDSQRGVSLASTEYPLLSNAARGFARASDAGTRKLKVDLGKVPLPGEHEAPNLVNYYQKIPGFEQNRVKAPKQVTYNAKTGKKRTTPGKKSQPHFDWSTSKNRELFLRELLPGYVKGQKKPSPLEDQTYTPETVDELLKVAKGQEYEPL